jgi:hypothetical protein
MPICSEFCADSHASCLSAGYLALASHNALLTLGSPVEALVSQDEFLNRAARPVKRAAPHVADA